MRMTDSLNARAWFGIAFLAVAMALVLFLSAWTIDYWQAWVYLGVFFGASIPITVYLMKNNRALLRRRFWSSVPLYAIVIGDALTALCFYITFLAYRENSFTSATIEIAQDQTVISTGPYATVRHPMYAGGSLLFIGTPLALGSYWGLLAFGGTLPALIWRLLDEERFLTESLAGYAEYCRNVRWRLIPGLF